MYAWFNSATHHIFFPPRLEVVAEQQDSNCLPAHPGHQLPLDGLLGHQANRPTGIACRRLATNQGADPLLLRFLQQRRRTTSLPLVQGALQAAPLIAVANPPAGVWGQMDDLGHCWCGQAEGQLLQGEGTQKDSDPLNACSQKVPKLLLLFRRYPNFKGALRHAPV